MLDITFLGTDCWIPEADNDASGFLVNRKYLIDTGYFLQNSLTKLGIKTHEIEHLFFTHMHHDHYMALPQLIFFYLQKGRPLEELHIYGPKRDLRRVVKLAMRFLQKDADMEFYRGTGYPTLHELDGGETITFEDVIIETCPSFHAVDGICYRFTDRETGRVLGITGDTFYAPHIPKALHDCDLLVHENTRTTAKSDYDNPPGNRHSSIYDCVRTASESGAKRMAVVHLSEKSVPDVLKLASELTDIEVFYPEHLKPYIV